MGNGLNEEYWDYLVDTLYDRGTINEEQVTQAKSLAGSDKFRYVNDYVSEDTWERVDNNTMPAVLDFLDIEYNEDDYSNCL